MSSFDATVDLERHPDNQPPSGPLTHWVDTNVMLEVYSHGDLYDAFEDWQRGKGTSAIVEERRVRMQGSLWMAMALCEAGARSITYQHENLRNILRLAPPSSTQGAWTSSILYVLGDGGVFDGWERHMTNDGQALTNRQRDAHMIQVCRDDAMVLVTRDAQVIGEASRVGVDAVDPETYAVRYLTREDARRMFEQRLTKRRRDQVSRGGSTSGAEHADTRSAHTSRGLRQHLATAQPTRVRVTERPSPPVIGARGLPPGGRPASRSPPGIGRSASGALRSAIRSRRAAREDRPGRRSLARAAMGSGDCRAGSRLLDRIVAPRAERSRARQHGQPAALGPRRRARAVHRPAPCAGAPAGPGAAAGADRPRTDRRAARGLRAACFYRIRWNISSGFSCSMSTRGAPVRGYGTQSSSPRTKKHWRRPSTTYVSPSGFPSADHSYSSA